MKVPRALSLLAALAVFGFDSAASAQPTEAQLERIAALVEEGKFDEAKIRAEALLEVYPDDPILSEIQRLLREKLAALPPAPPPPPAPAVPPPVATPPAPLPPVETTVVPAPPDKTAFAYWMQACEAPSKDFGDGVENHAFRMGHVQRTWAYAGRFEEAFSRLDALRAEGKLPENQHSYFLRLTGFELATAGRMDEAMTILPKIRTHWHRRELARGIAETCVEKGRGDLARSALQTAYEAQEQAIREQGGEARNPVNRCRHFVDMALTAVAAGLTAEAADYTRRAAEFAGQTPDDYAAFTWSIVGGAYAQVGDLSATEKALERMTSGKQTTATAAYNGWKNAVKARVDAGDMAGARRLLNTGRAVLNKASRKYKTITKADVAEHLSDALLSPEPFAQAIEGKRPDEALRLYAADKRTLRFNGGEFESILDLFIELGRLDDARQMLAAPKLGFYAPPNNQEDIKETAGTLAYLRGKLAGALLAQKGPAAQEAYVATLPTDAPTRYQIAIESAYALARKSRGQK